MSISAIRWSGPPISTRVCANAVEKLRVVSVDAVVGGRSPMASLPLMTRTGSASQSSLVKWRAVAEELVAFDLGFFTPSLPVSDPAAVIRVGRETWSLRRSRCA